MLQYGKIWACVFLPLASGIAPANADGGEATPWVNGAEARLRLVAGAGTSGLPYLGLVFDLRPGWKIFWRTPGAPGLPPQLDWRGSRNLKSARIIWPAPQLFTSFGFRARGYGGKVTLPVRIEASDRSKPVRVKALVRYQVCKDVCIPGEATLRLAIPPKMRPHAAVTAALARTPQPAGRAFSDWRVTLNGRRLVAVIKPKKHLPRVNAVILEPQQRVRLGRTGPVVKHQDGSLSVSIPLLGTAAPPRRLSVRVTVLAGRLAWEKTVRVPGPVRR